MLKITLVCFATMIVLAILGERTLVLFDGNRALAARVMIALYAVLGGVGFGCAQPALWRGFAHKLQKIVATGGSEAPLGRMIQKSAFPITLYRTGQFACGVFCIAALVLGWFSLSGRL